MPRRKKRTTPDVCKHFTELLGESSGYLLERMPYKNELQKLHDHMVSDRRNFRFSPYTDREMSNIIGLLKIYDNDFFNSEITNFTSREFKFRLIRLNQNFAQVQQKRQIHKLIQSKSNRLVNAKMQIISGLSVEDRRRWCFQDSMQHSYRLSDVSRRRQGNLGD